MHEVMGVSATKTETVDYTFRSFNPNLSIQIDVLRACRLNIDTEPNFLPVLLIKIHMRQNMCCLTSSASTISANNLNEAK